MIRSTMRDNNVHDLSDKEIEKAERSIADAIGTCLYYLPGKEPQIDTESFILGVVMCLFISSSLCSEDIDLCITECKKALREEGLAE